MSQIMSDAPSLAGLGPNELMDHIFDELYGFYARTGREVRYILVHSALRRTCKNMLSMTITGDVDYQGDCPWHKYSIQGIQVVFADNIPDNQVFFVIKEATK